MAEVRFLNFAEEYIARHEPEKTVEEIMVEFSWIVTWHKRFERHMKKTLGHHNKTKPRKSPEALERRKLFINWYIEHEKNKGRYITEIIDELTLLTFSSRTTITDTIYNYR